MHASALYSSEVNTKICKQEHKDCHFYSDLTELLKTENNYNVLRDIWVKWRDVSGKTMREDYKMYIELENEVANLNGKSFELMNI